MSERTPDYTSRMPGEEQRITEKAVRLAALHYRDNMDGDHAIGLEIFAEWDDPEMPETLVGYSVGTVHGMPGDQTEAARSELLGGRFEEEAICSHTEDTDAVSEITSPVEEDNDRTHRSTK